MGRKSLERNNKAKLTEQGHSVHSCGADFVPFVEDQRIDVFWQEMLSVNG